MNKLIKSIKYARNYLAYKIFASFWLTFAILLGIALALPNLDARTFSLVENRELAFFQKESHKTTLEYDLDQIFDHRLAITTPRGFDMILLERNSGLLSGIDHRHLKYIQAFLFKADNPKAPLQRRFGDMEFHGPFLVKTERREYYQYFAQHVDPQREVVNQFFDSPWIMLLIFLLISSPILLWLAWKIAKPVKALRRSAKSVATGNLTIDPKLETETEDIYELKKVAQSFNQMITSLQRLRSYQQRLLSDISHELKTPLTRMQLAVSLIRRRTGESNELDRIENEIDKLNTMIMDLLSLSRQEIGQHLAHEIFAIPKIWEDVLEDAKFETEQSNITLYVNQEIPFPEHYYINGNPNTLASTVENVIRNAKKYAKSCIKVMIYLDDLNHLFITVDDDGDGVPSEEYENIFRPFYRVGHDRARQTGGTGLGLAIVANAIQQHRGKVQASQSPMGGLRITIRLPLWSE